MDEINSTIVDLYYKYQTYDPFKIAEFYNLIIRYVEFDEAPHGEVVYIRNKIYILIDSNFKNTNQRYFICAHELFHYLKHLNSKTYDSNSNEKGFLEQEADYFAARLAQTYYKQLNNREAAKAKDLSFFGVPEKIAIDLVY